MNLPPIYILAGLFVGTASSVTIVECDITWDVLTLENYTNKHDDYADRCTLTSPKEIGRIAGKRHGNHSTNVLNRCEKAES